MPLEESNLDTGSEIHISLRESNPLSRPSSEQPAAAVSPRPSFTVQRADRNTSIHRRRLNQPGSRHSGDRGTRQASVQGSGGLAARVHAHVPPRRTGPGIRTSSHTFVTPASSE